MNENYTLRKSNENSMKELIEEMGYSQRQAAFKMGISPSHFSKVIKGQSKVSKRLANQIKPFFDGDQRADYIFRTDGFLSPGDSWKSLYYTQVGLLEEVYTSSTPVAKGVILEGLEKLVGDLRE